jgi:hypothetical protein
VIDPIAIINTANAACNMVSADPDILVGWVRLLVHQTTPEAFLALIRAISPGDVGAAQGAVQACLGAPA